MSGERVKDGIINLDTDRAKPFGFTSDKYDGYLWKTDGRIMISFIKSRQEGRGNLSRLFQSIWNAGYEVAVPTPLGKMPLILKHKGFKQTFEDDDVFGAVEVWIKPPQAGR